jgi:hypothetical protein
MHFLRFTVYPPRMASARLSTKAYILSPDRRMRNPDLIPTLEHLKIPFEIIDKSSVPNTLEYLSKQNKNQSKDSPFTIQQLACTYGHYLMHQEALRGKHEWALFFENDATIDSDLLVLLLDSVEMLPTGLILLGSCGGWAKKNQTIQFSELAIHKVFNSAVTGSHAYLMKTSLLKQFIGVEQNLISLADEFIRDSLPMFVTKPFVSYQEGFTPSEIPLKTSTSKGSSLRRISSAIFADLRDYPRLGRFGNRLLRLEFFERPLGNVLMKLDGCNLYHQAQIGSSKDQE